MECPNPTSLKTARLVGDPVDAITGANTDCSLEFELPGPIPLYWRRCYDSFQNTRRFSLGWGHAHYYDRRLQFDADGIRYIGPAGAPVHFPPLESDGDDAAGGGFLLRRISMLHYRLFESGHPSMEFQFRDPSRSTPVKSLRAYRRSVHFHYDADEHLELIVDSSDRRIRVEHDQEGKVLALVREATGGQPEMRLIEYQYDQAGNLVRGVDAYNHRFRFAYDAANRMTIRTDRRNYSFHFEYDKEGRCVHSWGDGGLHDTRLRYMPEQKCTVVTRADGGDWLYIYDDSNSLLKVVEPDGGVRQFQYDQQGRLEQETAPSGEVSTVIYNALGGEESRIPDPAVAPPLLNLMPIAEDPHPPNPTLPQPVAGPVEWEHGGLIDPTQVELPPPDDPSLGDLPDRVRSAIATSPPPLPHRPASPCGSRCSPPTPAGWSLMN